VTAVDVAVSCRRAQALIDVGRHQQALTILGDVLAGNPDEPTALCLVARCHYAAGQYRQMLATTAHATSVAPDFEWPYRLHSNALAALRKKGPAIDAARRAVALAPHSWLTHLVLGERLLDMDTMNSRIEAYDCARRAIEIDPGETSTHNLMARALTAMGDARGATRAYHAALAIDPNNTAAINNLGVQQLRSGRLRGGAEKVRTAVAADPQHAAFQYNTHFAAHLWLWQAVEAGAVATLIEGLLRIVSASPVRLIASAGVVVAALAFVAVSYVRLDPLIRRMVRTFPDAGPAMRLSRTKATAIIALEIVTMIALPFPALSVLTWPAVTVVIGLAVHRLTVRAGQRLARIRRRRMHRTELARRAIRVPTQRSAPSTDR
jgi:Flp pilus assembly protein TadD